MERIHEFLEIAGRLKQEKLVTDSVNKGSISCRISEDAFLISPSKIPYDKLTEADVNIMRTDGSYVSKNAPVSRDSYFHQRIYSERKDVNAVIHTHSKYAVALCLANRPLPFITYGMKFHCGGPVGIAPFALPNSEECNRLIMEYLGDRKAVLLQNHGLVCVGASLTDCYETAEFIESLSESYIHALMIGNVNEITLGKEDTYGKV
jgi:ribulose-5-phosphate 4-epimerase/fuculose-1-phosphate aldolase